MFKNKTSKKARTICVVLLLVCVASLLGVTFAWFTDSATTAANRIASGTLEVELWHTNWQQTEPENVEGLTTKLFPVLRWEPGVVAYENFEVKNMGSLALQYRLAMRVLDENFAMDDDGELRSLTEVLKVAVVPGGFTGGREEAIALARDAESMIALDKTVNSFVLVPDKDLLEPEASDTFAVIVYWEPSDEDDTFNINNGKKLYKESGSEDFLHNRLTLDLDIQLLATQATYEYDSNGNDYDENALYPDPTPTPYVEPEP